VRLGFASPLPPATSGIADYAAELLPALARHGCDPVVFFEGAPPTDEIRRRFETVPLAELPRRLDGIDRIVYQLGNSAAHHAGIHRALLEHPGVVTLHEFMLHHLVRDVTLGAGEPRAYVEEMRYCAGESGRRAAQRLLDTHYPVDVWRFPLFERVVDRSRGVLVHSDFARRRILASRAGAAVRVVPFPVDVSALPAADSDARRAAKLALGLDEGAPLVASFGLVTPHKRLEPALAAFGRLRALEPRARFVICGEVSPHYDLDEVLARTSEEAVLRTGRVALAEFHRWMTACDVAVNLRHPTGGETSASLLRLLATGLPTLVTDAGSFAELPAGTVAKVPIDELEEEWLFELLRRLIADADLREAMGAAARHHVETAHALEIAAAAQAAAITELGALPAPPRDLAPPLGAWMPGDPHVELARSVGAAIADLGVDEASAPFLGEVGECLVELGFAPPASTK